VGEWAVTAGTQVEQVGDPGQEHRQAGAGTDAWRFLRQDRAWGVLRFLGFFHRDISFLLILVTDHYNSLDSLFFLLPTAERDQGQDEDKDEGEDRKSKSSKEIPCPRTVEYIRAIDHTTNGRPDQCHGQVPDHGATAGAGGLPVVDQTDGLGDVQVKCDGAEDGGGADVGESEEGSDGVDDKLGPAGGVIDQDDGEDGL